MVDEAKEGLAWVTAVKLAALELEAMLEGVVVLLLKRPAPGRGRLVGRSLPLGLGIKVGRLNSWRLSLSLSSEASSEAETGAWRLFLLEDVETL